MKQTNTWTTGSTTCVRDHSYACVYTRGFGTSTTSQHNILTRKKLSRIVLVLRTGFEPRVLVSRVDAVPIEPPRHPVMVLVVAVVNAAVVVVVIWCVVVVDVVVIVVVVDVV